jgi:hypothetical protein
MKISATDPPGDCPGLNIGNQRGRIFALPGVKKRRLFEEIPDPVFPEISSKNWMIELKIEKKP